MGEFISLLKTSLKGLARTPGFTFVVVCTLALGIGATSGVFSVFHQLLLKPLPVHEPERLVNLGAPGPRQGSTSCGIAGPCSEVFSYPMFRDLESVQSVFSGLAAHVDFGANIAFEDRTVSADGLLVSGAYFPVLGLSPAQGRLIGPADDAEIDHNRIAVLAHAFWERELGGDPAVVGETIRINGQALTVAGIGPPGFGGTTLGREVEVFVPLTLRWFLHPTLTRDHQNRLNHYLYLFARLQPGIGMQQAREAINVPYRNITREVEAPLQTQLGEEALARFLDREISLAPGAHGQSEVTNLSRVPMSIVLGATGLLLLIACANVANLMLARVVGRGGEIAVRAALGAGRAHLVGRLLLESVLLALAGGVAGIVLARGLITLFGGLLADAQVSGIEPVINSDVLLFAVGLSLATALLCGGYPALRASRIAPAAALQDQSGRGGGGRGPARFRNALVTVQIALSATLLITAGLFTHSLWNLSRSDPGLDPESVLTFAVSPGRSGYTAAESMNLFEQIEEELGALPGVEAATAAAVTVLEGYSWHTRVGIEGFETASEIDTVVQMNMVSPSFFRALGIPLQSGRAFTRADGPGASGVVIVNEAFVRRFELGNDVPGRRITYDSGDEQLEIVGVVGNARTRNIKHDVDAEIFIPYRQAGDRTRINFYVRARNHPEDLFGTVRSSIAQIDPHLPVEQLSTLNDVIRGTLVLDRSVGTLSAWVAAFAIVLVAVGLYGVLSYTIIQRTREIGLRAALGADSGRLQRMIGGQVVRMLAIGGLAGLAMAVLLARSIESLLFELNGLHPATAVAGLVVIVTCAFAAAYLPARKVALVQPMEALRYG